MAVLTLILLLILVCFLVLDHVAKFCSRNFTLQAFEQLICPACRFASKEGLDEARAATVARLWPMDTLFYYLFEWKRLLTLGGFCGHLNCCVIS